jgi:hypothetical protein
MTDEPRCAYCGGPVEGCTTIRDDNNWWMGLHGERPDVVALRERQRLVRVRLGHETVSGRGVLRVGIGITRY